MNDDALFDNDHEVAEAPNRVTSYQVLARKYRPASFDSLIGQEVLVRTLRNAIKLGRLAHAFIMTGERGTGKTTTARIIAKTINCTKNDDGSIPLEPCGVCDSCVSVTEGRNVDVIEMDAASHTSVDDVREVIESIKFRPVAARFKVYIIDEVHMLSRNAFNALLKTLEEPPAHAKFIFATTEIKKVPVTVLSRCQRFDLRRVDVETLTQHFASICVKESVEAEEEALKLIAKVADGSVRDGLSLLDQAIAVSERKLDSALLQSMLGLADKGQIFTLLGFVLQGEAPKALELFDSMYNQGVMPQSVLSDLCVFIHLLARLKISGVKSADPSIPHALHKSAVDLAHAMPLSSLMRAWQLATKSIPEVSLAPAPKLAVDMVLIKLGYSANLPDPAGLIKHLGKSEASASSSVPNTDSSVAPPVSSSLPSYPQKPIEKLVKEKPFEEKISSDKLVDLPAIIEVAHAKRELRLANALEEDIELLRLSKLHLDIALISDSARVVPTRLAKALQEWTGDPWVVVVSDVKAQSTLGQKQRDVQESERIEVLAHPHVKQLMETFSGAKLVNIKENNKESNRYNAK